MNPFCPNCQKPTTYPDLADFLSGVITCTACETDYNINGKEIEVGNADHKKVSGIPSGLKVKNGSAVKTIILKSGMRRSLASALVTILIILAWTYFNFEPIILGEVQWNWIFLIPLSVILLTFLHFFLPQLRRRIIRLDRKKIQVSWRPQRLLARSRSFTTADFRQFYVKQHVHRHDGSTIRDYSLQGILRNNMDVAILSGIQYPEEAYYLEQEFEKFFRINDVIQAGEYDRRKQVDLSPLQKLKAAWRIFRNTQKEKISLHQ